MQKNAVVAFHGQQGSGKTALTKYVESLATKLEVFRYGIKSTFSKYATDICEDLGLETSGADLLRYKQLQLAISTWGETQVNKMIWTDKYVKEVASAFNQLVITDDIRTEMNVSGLLQLAEAGREVYLFALRCPEEVRRARCSAWRPEGGYTEQPLQKPTQALPPNFHWIEVDTSLSLGHSQDVVHTALQL